MPPAPDPPTLKDCSELRELVFQSLLPTSSDVSFILSITSLNIQKIIFERWPREHEERFSLDIALSDLVDRLRASGYERTLEVEFRPEPEIYLNVNPDEIFPRFREKGRVTIRGAADEIIYRSGG